FFFFTDTAPTEIYTLSLHDALPISLKSHVDALPDAERLDIMARHGLPLAGVDMRIVDEDGREIPWDGATMGELQVRGPWVADLRSEEHTSELQSRGHLVCRLLLEKK